jgi:hypothetical protein
MRDSEMTFEVVERDGVTDRRPFYFRNDYAGVEHVSVKTLQNWEQDRVVQLGRQLLS